MTGSSVVSSRPVAATYQPARRDSNPALPQGERLRVLLIEDDEGDAFLVREYLAETDAAIDLVMATSLTEARQRIAGVD
ncbi:MAG TPA: transcriptional regulator, partial [Micromonosporaceae bacterium]|nr:transcriptional regulator [Micromonosporaceae bacterium]